MKEKKLKRKESSKDRTKWRDKWGKKKERFRRERERKDLDTTFVKLDTVRCSPLQTDGTAPRTNCMRTIPTDHTSAYRHTKQIRNNKTQEVALRYFALLSLIALSLLVNIAKQHEETTKGWRKEESKEIDR